MTANNNTLHGIQRQVCEIWSRVVGYLRPVNQWNSGKKAEFKDRKTLKTQKDKK